MKNENICCICGKKFTGYGNNPSPVKIDGVCCDTCNSLKVIPARIDGVCAGIRKRKKI